MLMTPKTVRKQSENSPAVSPMRDENGNDGWWYVMICGDPQPRPRLKRQSKAGVFYFCKQACETTLGGAI